jgi:hypothetical protein
MIVSCWSPLARRQVKPDPHVVLEAFYVRHKPSFATDEKIGARRQPARPARHRALVNPPATDPPPPGAASRGPVTGRARRRRCAAVVIATFQAKGGDWRRDMCAKPPPPARRAADASSLLAAAVHADRTCARAVRASMRMPYACTPYVRASWDA